MKKLLIILLAVLCASCTDLRNTNPYELSTVEVRISIPESFEPYIDRLSGLKVTFSDINTTATYTTGTDSHGTASITLPCGVYRAMTETIETPEAPFNAASSITVSSDTGTLELLLKKGRIGDICIKEIYCGGCMKLPEEGSYQSDSYVILHNNSSSVQYLDGLCFGTADPYNSNSNPVWAPDIEFVPIIQAVWEFPGDGDDFPLRPGEDAVVALFGAIDHTAQYPLSVNLNRPDCFVCYNSSYFFNTVYHPAPGDRISPDRILNAVIKVGRANAYTFSTSSPAVLIWRPQGCTMSEFVTAADNVIQKPGSSDDRIVCVPEEWIEDGVEVFNGQSSANKKRLHAIVDGGFVTLSVTHSGKTLMRRVNAEKSSVAGYEVLCDTNNSSADFYERQTQSLHDE